MILKRLRLGELTALAGAVCVIVSLTLTWYENSSGKLDAWDTFGPAVVLLIIAAALTVTLFIAVLIERSTALPVALAVWSTLFGAIAVICAVIRLLERPHGADTLCAGSWLALAGALAILAGAWQSMRDERPGLYSAATPPPRKPAV